jgi:pimeloyl-ACP methyl ester carboxylesterase
MKRATVDGIELEFEVTGRGEPLILIHGGIVGDAFAPVFREPALTERYHLIRYHRRGFGGSARPAGPVTTGQQAADCLGLMRYLGIERAHIGSYSYGGAIALQLALDAPGAVHTLALFEPFLLEGITDPAALEFVGKTGQTAYERYAAGDAAGAIDAFSRGAFGPDYSAALERALPGARAQAVADADALFRVELPEIQQWRLDSEAVRRLTQPVLSVYHHEPAWAGFRLMHDFVLSLLPQTETFVLPATTHLLQMVNPSAAAAALAGFLARHPLPVPAGVA